MLECHDITITRDGQTRLGPVTTTVQPARLTVILGHNGAGKSLFLRVVHGLLTPQNGAVTWDGQTPAMSRARRGFVFQSTPLMRRSVAQNVEFPLIARHMVGPARRARVAEVLDQAGLTAWADNPAATLSGGEKQRLALARALVTQPDTILLDEPAASLDPVATRAMEQMIRQTHAQGTGILMSTHDLGQARRLAEDVMLFAAGKLCLHIGKEEFFSDTAPQEALDFRAGGLGLDT